MSPASWPGTRTTSRARARPSRRPGSVTSRIPRCRPAASRIALAMGAVGPGRVVLGLLRKAELDGDPSVTAERVMRPGPKTFRPNVTLEELLKSMREHDIQTNSLVTTGEGRLLGVISRADAEATLAHEQA